MATKFYPQISSIVNIDNLPDQLGFIKNGLSNLLDGIYFKDLQFSKSAKGDSAFYSLSVVSFKRLDIEIPGTGFFLILNPSHDQSTSDITEFPITLNYQWEILSFIRGFNLTNFSFSSSDLFQLATTISGLSEKELVDRALSVFISEADPINQFVTDINTLYGTNLPLPTGSDPVNEVISSINSNSQFGNVSIVLFSVYIFDAVNDDNTKIKINDFFANCFGDSTFDYIKDLVVPKIDATLNLGVGIEFPRNVLKPIDETTLEPIEDENVKSMLRFNAGDFYFSTERGIGYDQSLTADLDPSQIGNTGFKIDFNNAKLDISTKTNIKEADLDGRPVDFVGVYVEELNVYLPEKWFKSNTTGVNPSGNTLEIFGEKLLIGTGGLSGKVGLRATNGNSLEDDDELFVRIGGTDSDPDSGFKLGFKKFELDFQQNSIKHSEVKGSLTFPDNFKDASNQQLKVEIEADFYENGDFSITASEDQGIEAIIDNVLSIKITELEVGRVNDSFYIETKGDLTIENTTIKPYIPEPIAIKRLRIWDDGKIEFVGGGSLVLPEPKTLKVGPVELSVTALHIGSHEQYIGTNLRKYAYIGFDGGINVNPGGVDARGDGIKFYFTIDGGTFDFFIRIESIRVDLIIPGNASPDEAAVLLSGYLAMKQPEGSTGTEYTGGVSIALPRVNISGSAAMRLNPKIPSFLIDLGLELPVPITLGPTGLGIYGFRGLIGQRYVATKEAIGAHDWWDYYKKKVSPDFSEGIQPSKFEQTNGFSVGAGASIATVEPSGDKKAFTSKIFFMLSMPNVLLIQGQAAVVKERIGLDTTNDPPFSAMLAIDDESITTAFGVNYKIPEQNGKILKLDALLEMGFFYHDSSAWYINVGTKDNPVQGKIFKDILNINAYAYLMLFAGGIETGAGISFSKNASLGPLRAELSAFIDVYGKINFVPVQIGAGMSLGGSVSLKIWRWGTTLSAAASIAAEVPEPFVVSGKVKACIRVLRKNRCIKFNFSWTFDDTVNADRISLHQVGKGASAKNIMSKETFALYGTESSSATLPSGSVASNFPVIPMDSKIDIEFLKPVDTSSTSNFGTENSNADNYEERIPKKKGKLQQAIHNFKVEDVTIYYRDGGAWHPYSPFDAVQPVDTNIVVTPSNTNHGYWQLGTQGRVNKLSVLARSPIEWYREGTEMPDLGLFNVDTNTAIFCPGQNESETCINYDNYNSSSVPVNSVFNHDGLGFKLIGSTGSVQEVQNPFGFENGLILAPGHQLEIYFPEAVALAKLQILAKTPSAHVSYYKQVGASYELISTSNLSLVDMVLPIAYEDEANPVDKIVVEPVGGCEIDCETLQGQLTTHVASAITDLQAQAATLETEIAAHQALCDDSGSLESVQNCAMANMKTQQLTGIQQMIANLSAFEVAPISTSCFVLQENADNVLLENGIGQILLEEGTCISNTYPCGVYLFSVCWQTVSNYTVDNIVPLTETYETVTAMIEALEQTVEPIWRPGVEYLIQVHTKDIITGGASATHDKYYNYGFRTAGPLGYFHEHDTRYTELLGEGREDEYKLSKLKHYIDVQRSYPNADGNIVNAKPLFYKEAKIKLLFKYPYVYTMYTDLAPYGGLSPVQSALDIVIKDPQREEAIAYADTQWSISQAEITDVDVEVLNNFMNGQNCVQATSTELLNVELIADVLNLEPSKMYSAIFNAVYGAGTPDPKEVHKYAFQTSRYGNFAEQLYSYLTIADDIELTGPVDLSTLTIIKEACFDLVRTFAIDDINEAKSIVTTYITNLENDSNLDYSNDTLTQSYSHVYDRIFDGALKLDAMDTPETTEFTTLWHVDEAASEERILGIIVRCPEPFNNPKLTDKELEDSIKVMSGSSEDPAYKVILSKDRSKAFITKTTLNLSTTDERISVRFKYLEYDEANAVYAVLSNANEIVIDCQVIAPKSQLEASTPTTDVGLRDVLQAETITGAYAYEFLIENTASGFETTYLREDIDAKLPLYEIEGLEHNTDYSIKVKPLMSGRRTDYGTAVSITTVAE